MIGKDKCRVWSNRENKYFYIGDKYTLVFNSSDNWAVHDHNAYDDYCGEAWECDDKGVLEWWTGLLDKSGKEIYFNDIFIDTLSGGRKEVVGEWNYIWWMIDIDKCNNPMAYIEVVGNVHETPELMEGSTRN